MPFGICYKCVEDNLKENVTEKPFGQFLKARGLCQRHLKDFQRHPEKYPEQDEHGIEGEGYTGRHTGEPLQPDKDKVQMKMLSDYAMVMKGLTGLKVPDVREMVRRALIPRMKPVEHLQPVESSGQSEEPLDTGHEPEASQEPEASSGHPAAARVDSGHTGQLSEVVDTGQAPKASSGPKGTPLIMVPTQRTPVHVQPVRLLMSTGQKKSPTKKAKSRKGRR